MSIWVLRVYPQQLYNAGLLEGSECAILLDCLERSSRNIQDKSLLELRDVDALLLEIRVLPNCTTRIELCCSSAVRVSTAHH